MTEFNPTLNDTGVPNMTGASSGTGANKTFEALFGGLADTFEGITQLKDDATQRKIADDAQQMFDSVNTEFGFDAPDVPAGMQSELSRVQSLQNALQQGKISEVNYYGRLATLSKQLRTKYPRYEDIVDKTIQSVTGTRPANAYRDAIFSELNHLATEASDEAKFRDYYEKQYQGEIATIFGADYFKNPDKYSFEDVQTKVAEFQSKTLAIDTEQKQLSLLAKRGEVNDKRATKAISQDFSFVVQSGLNSGLGANNKNFTQMLNDFASSGGQNLNEMTQAITMAETQVRASLEKRGREQYVATGIMTQDDVNKAIDAAMYPITKAKEAILGGDYKYAARWAMLNKAIADQQLNEVLNRSPAARAGIGLNELNQQFGEEFYRSNISEIETVSKEVAGQAISGMSPSVIKDTIETGNNKVSTSVFKTSIDVLKNPKLGGDKMSNLVKQLYGPNAIDLMDPNVVSKDDLETIYTTMLDPRVIQNIANNGTPEDLQMVTDWALEKFGAIPTFRSAAGDLKDSMDALDEAEISFDPATNRLKIEVAKDSPFNPFDITGSNLDVKRLRLFLGSFNRAMSVLGPLADAQGEDKQKMVDRLLDNLSIEYETKDSGGFFSTIKQKIGEAATAAEENLKKAPKASDMIPLNLIPEAQASELPQQMIELPQIVVKPTEIDFVLSSPEAATDLATDPVYGVQVRQMANGPVTGPLSDFENEKSAFAVASKFNGLSEGRDRTVLAQFIKKATGTSIDPAKTAWCAAFVNAALGASGKEGTDSLAARSFLSYGEPTDSPTKGDIVVLSRGNSKWQGHVGFFVSEDEDSVTILGGNQGNKVSVKSFPKSKVLGYRKPPQIQ